jgi:multidrug efflux pump subunit AcrB
VLIDFANRKRIAGMNDHDAIHSAGIHRFRPILLTTLTTFGGLTPMIFETSCQVSAQPLATSVQSNREGEFDHANSRSGINPVPTHEAHPKK